MAYTAINKSSNFFNTILYTGNGNSGHAQTGVGFQPDLVWLKQRSGTEYHNLYDAVRGVTKRFVPNRNDLENTISGLTAFGSDGFTVGAADTANQNSTTFVAWNWKANGQGSSNTDGSINTTYTSANTTSGCSVVKYSANNTAGATVGHGLGVIPKMILVKESTGSVNDWVVYHASVGNTKKLILNETNAESIDNFMNDTTPTSTVFSISDASVVNRTGSTYMAYCFAEVQGFSKFGTYKANENTDGTFTYCGFKPAFVLIKQSNLARDWYMYDNKRNTFNVINKEINANNAGAEDTGDAIDFLSNGFKIRTTGASLNDAGGTYLYMCFAENPFVTGDSATPTTAR